jgi:putative ABC transport system substrate-binding protein
MRRREFVILVGGAATWSAVADAQRSTKPSIGYLGLTSASGEAEIVAAFRKGLQEAGFGEVQIDFRFAEGDVRRLPALAAELVQCKPDLIFCGSTAAALAAKAATPMLPIIFVIGADPIKTGLVPALNRPGGHVTGISFFTNQMETKRLGLLHEMVPKADVVGVLLNPNNPFFHNQLADLTEAASALGITIHLERASDETAVGDAFKAFARQHAGALLVGADLYFTSRRALLIGPANELRLPAISEWREFVEAGALMSYGTALADSFRQAGVYAAHVLKGQDPGELPVLQASKFEFLINLKTTKQIGIDVPPGLSARADDIIE